MSLPPFHNSTNKNQKREEFISNQEEEKDRKYIFCNSFYHWSKLLKISQGSAKWRKGKPHKSQSQISF